MKLDRRWLLIVLVALAAAWAGLGVGLRSHEPAQVQPGPGSGDAVSQLLATPFTTPDGQTKSLSEWKGKLLVVNFWATWCPPCREEMPEFSRAQDKYGPNGVQFVGIAIDNSANVVEFSKNAPVAYPLLIAPPNLPELMAKLGNLQQALPFTVIIDRDGKLHTSHLGRMSGEYLDKQLGPLL